MSTRAGRVLLGCAGMLLVAFAAVAAVPPVAAPALVAADSVQFGRLTVTINPDSAHPEPRILAIVFVRDTVSAARREALARAVADALLGDRTPVTGLGLGLRVTQRTATSASALHVRSLEN